MNINKSTRHSKITGDFTEDLVLYFLSKYGFESANIDHTGIDIIARNPEINEVMGISVKGRSKTEKALGSCINIPSDNFTKVENACQAFNLKPYFAIVSDEIDKIYVFILPMNHLLELFPDQDKMCTWKMTKEYIEKYHNDPKIMAFEFDYRMTNWWKMDKLSV